MSTAEEITAQIVELGNKIKQAKADKQPKELWDEHLQAMLKAKVRSVCCGLLFWVWAWIEWHKRLF